MARLQANGIGIEYEIHGEGTPLLFIHGLGSTRRDWDPQMTAFAKNYQVISFDLRGHGESDKPAGPYSIAMFAADAAALLRALNIEAVHVVGISLGGAIAFQLTLDHPDLVRSLTIVNSGPEAIVRGLLQKFGVWLRFQALRKGRIAQLGKAIGMKLFPAPESHAARDGFIERFAHNDPLAYEHSLRALIGWSVAERIGDIKCPVLSIAADKDYTPLSFKEAYVARIPGAKLEVVADSRHALPMEKPAQFNAVLEKFLAASQTH